MSRLNQHTLAHSLQWQQVQAHTLKGVNWCRKGSEKPRVQFYLFHFHSFICSFDKTFSSRSQCLFLSYKMLCAFLKGTPILAHFSQQHSLTDPAASTKEPSGKLETLRTGKENNSDNGELQTSKRFHVKDYATNSGAVVGIPHALRGSVSSGWLFSLM